MKTERKYTARKYTARKYRAATALVFLLFFAQPFLLLAQTPAQTGGRGHGVSGYAGEDRRAIKSLSARDIADLQAGRGWGLAKAAELNGLPGPAHLLELKSEIGLTEAQTEKIERLFTGMKHRAMGLGAELIELERQLDGHFAQSTITGKLLRELLNRIGRVRTALRLTHLETHLRTPEILTARQIARYNALRGYTSNTPQGDAASAPQGDNPHAPQGDAAHALHTGGS